MAFPNLAPIPPERSRRWKFADCEFVEISRELVVGGTTVKLESKPLDVLQHLLEHPNQVLSKDELIGAAWSTSTTEDAAVYGWTIPLTVRPPDLSGFRRCVYFDENWVQVSLMTIEFAGFRANRDAVNHSCYHNRETENIPKMLATSSCDNPVSGPERHDRDQDAAVIWRAWRLFRVGSQLTENSVVLFEISGSADRIRT